MARRFENDRLIVASHNPGKVREISELLAPLGIDVVSAGALDLPEPEETGSSFIENARIKALSAAITANIPALADDSGLCIDALHGAPGIYSARWAGPEKDFSIAMARVEKEVGGQSSKAHFTCALCLAWPDGHSECFEGHVHGRLVFPPKGLKGFGYDPIFQADGHKMTFAEMEPEHKHAISHRADAFQQLLKACFPQAD